MSSILYSVKVALGAESVERIFTLITLGKVVTFPLITTFKTNRPPNYLFVNRIPN